MLRKLSLTALAVVSMSAMAMADGNPMADQDMRKDVLWQATNLTGGDQYYLGAWLDRLPSQYERTIVKALSSAHTSAMSLRDTIAMSRWNSDGTEKMNWDDKSTWWNNTDETMRPMRMVMSMPSPREVGYNEALSALTAGLNATESGLLTQAFWGNERGRDILTRLVKDNASIADTAPYHHTWQYHPM